MEPLMPPVRDRRTLCVPCLAGIIIMLAMMSCEALETGPDTLDGIWRCQEVSQTFGNQAYDVTMSYAPNDSTIIRMSNFYNLGAGKVVMAEVDLWELNINAQNVEGLVFNGTGIVSGNRKKIDFSYTVFDGQSTDVVSATFTR